MRSEFDNQFYEEARANRRDRTDMQTGNARLMHSIPPFHIITPCGAIAAESDCFKTKVGRPPRQRTSDPDHKLSVLEAAMADKADTRIPRERQDDRYSRAVPIGRVVHNILTNLAKKVGK